MTTEAAISMPLGWKCRGPLERWTILTARPLSLLAERTSGRCPTDVVLGAFGRLNHFDSPTRDLPLASCCRTGRFTWIARCEDSQCPHMVELLFGLTFSAASLLMIWVALRAGSKRDE